MAKITVDLDITKQELKDKQEFVEVHEFKLLGMIEALCYEGAITQKTYEVMRAHLGDITNYASSLYWKLHAIAPNE